MILRADTVLVSTIRLDEPALPDVLDEDERRRASRFMFDRDRRRFVAAHAATRAILGRYLNADPLSLRYEVGERGKPRLVDPPVDVRFNLSHAGERALLAVTVGREIGVDIEQLRVVSNLMQLARSVFSAGEQERLRAASSSELHAVFFRMWTRKESFIKARGDGLHFPLKGFDVSDVPEAPQLLLSCEAEPSDVDRWTMVALPCEPGYIAALTVEGGGFTVRCDEGFSASTRALPTPSSTPQ
jgi:4'-phosphopantetheinyl transferase